MNLKNILHTLILSSLPVITYAQDFLYATNSGSITITDYIGTNTTVIIPSTVNSLPVTSVGNFAFNGTPNLTKVIIPDGVTTIRTGAFSACTNLTDISLPDSVSSISPLAFVECFSLTNFGISKNLQQIGFAAFDSCDSLMEFSVSASNAYFSSADGVLFNADQTTLLICPRGRSGSYTVPGNVTRIDSYAFSTCDQITTIDIPASVTTAGNYAFLDCENLVDISVHPQNPNYSSFNGVLFNKDQSSLLLYPGGITGTYSIPNGVTDIGFYAFNYCKKLTDIKIPESVTHIGINAFGRCNNLASIIMPKNMTTIDNSAFSDCPILNEVLFRGNTPEMIGTYLFQRAPNVIVYYLPGATGWNETFGDRPTEVWRPRIKDYDIVCGASTNQVEFNISWASGQEVVVESCSSLTNIEWQAVVTNTLTDDSIYFSDPNWTNYPNRYYRIRMP